MVSKVRPHHSKLLNPPLTLNDLRPYTYVVGTYVATSNNTVELIPQLLYVKMLLNFGSDSKLKCWCSVPWFLEDRSRWSKGGFFKKRRSRKHGQRREDRAGYINRIGGISSQRHEKMNSAGYGNEVAERVRISLGKGKIMTDVNTSGNLGQRRTGKAA